jgi:hypothetical protein
MSNAVAAIVMLHSDGWASLEKNPLDADSPGNCPRSSAARQRLNASSSAKYKSLALTAEDFVIVASLIAVCQICGERIW